MFHTIALFGTGLIGGSFALALRRRHPATRMVGFDRDLDAARRALELGVIDTIAADAAEAVRDADLVFLAVPVAQVPSLLGGIVDGLRDDALITDAGSTKGDVVAAARAKLGPRIERFVPGHPIAGREVHGPDAALATLYDGRAVILTPLAENAPQAIARVQALWADCGARVTTMPVAQHDRVLAAVSHLPHMLSYALVAQIVDSADAALKLGLAGAGFRDFTRIAASSPEMWRDVALANREALLAELDDYIALVAGLRASIAGSDGEALEALFDKASRARSAWKPAGPDVSA
ncbi:MAG TPA: prephenate dehydrogenase/arogenate dehydrogenase family protein [Dokdonella sp.]|uniref:prephenate dehydrogenase n=1 Tax=Dokdonella sp. TaxID=2291710 RepID=UPI0025C66F7F|nr:prephenate dehydrogenase/arogenate dehydrogenase family protein [Dokdonella sp.]MBX3691069.1 prephenate dehydrogenase/arogenate dehydrogenase family protein [Dokdonella sp.]MCW5568471.1 prephenate dehydrogenase/arogenate dehydrogenase family protein [Dokdonella sp.]HNR92881.1 prephenate dehydrogenase/arogenate dehydrogenase family protein [Dokdonella sp.]